MHILNEQEKRDKLRHLLIDLSKSQDALKDKKNLHKFFHRLENIYYNPDSDNYRHLYSDIFSCISVIDADSSLGNLDILAQNMEVIKDGYIPINMDNKRHQLIDISTEIVKLYDHTNLDISRINYTKRMASETKSELTQAQFLIQDLKEQLAQSDRTLDETTTYLKSESERLKNEVHESQKKMQNEYITILGIFAAIVLAFTGGMTFSSSVLENVHKASIYRLSVIVLFMGLVLFNLIWLLIDFLRDINGRGIRKKWIFLISNILIMICLILTCIAYTHHWFG